ncbi:hypothetical protein V8G54_026543 [Vigna mungo]|uniref:Uncharacterized protein n=1 Tax=Vigna mungo TaxID=3915 RepID=A0AAQ3RM92_VIGMU
MWTRSQFWFGSLAHLKFLESMLVLIGSSLTSASNVVELQTQVSSLTTQVNEMKTVISLLLQYYPGQLPSQLAATFQPSVSDQGSVPHDGCNEEEEPYTSLSFKF